jgi:hypothetical protein
MGIIGKAVCKYMEVTTERTRKKPPSPGASRVGRDYGGPHCWDLTSSALFTPPLPWQLYFGSEANLLASYNIPYDLKHLNQRLDENMTKYLVCIKRMRFSMPTAT